MLKKPNAFQVVSLADYHTNFQKSDTAPSSVPASFKPLPPRRRDQKPTVRAPKFSDADARADLKAGIHKGVHKSIAALEGFLKSEGSRGGNIIGHTKSGKPIYGSYGGAKPESLKHHEETAHGTYHVEHQGAGHHAAYFTAKRKNSRAKHVGGASNLDGALGRIADHKEEHAAPKNAPRHGDPGDGPVPLHLVGKLKKSLNHQESHMSHYEDLFKSELGIDGGAPLIDCPHCETPITKSELIAKARDCSDSSSEDDDMDKAGGPFGSGSSGGTIDRPMQTAPSSKPAAPRQQVSSGPKAPEPAGGRVSPSSSPPPKAAPAPAPTVGGHSTGGTVDRPMQMAPSSKPYGSASKSMPIIRGSEHVMWVDDGSDAALAKSIAEQSLGQGAFLNMPIDKNSTR